MKKDITIHFDLSDPFDASNKLCQLYHLGDYEKSEKVANTILWLIDWTETTTQNIKNYANKHDVSTDRLCFTKMLKKEHHLRRHDLVDIFLDSFVCNAHSTASDALWSHVPVVTLEGTHFASRVCSSLLRYVKTPELIAKTPKEYEKIVIDLIENPDKRQELKKQLEKTVPKTLFNTKKFVKELESAFEKVWKRYCDGKPVDHISV